LHVPEYRARFVVEADVKPVDKLKRIKLLLDSELESTDFEDATPAVEYASEHLEAAILELTPVRIREVEEV
jgi:hypothetical protein